MLAEQHSVAFRSSRQLEFPVTLELECKIFQLETMEFGPPTNQRRFTWISVF
jgi:hypothetical protein